MKLSKIVGLCLASTLAVGSAFAADNNNQANPAQAAASQATQAATAAQPAQAQAQPSQANQAVALMESDASAKKLTDSEITAKVKEKFLQDKLFSKKEMNAMNIRVKTSDGIVHLTGNLAKKDQEDKAVEAAKSIDGVKEVKSEFKIK